METAVIGLPTSTRRGRRWGLRPTLSRTGSFGGGLPPNIPRSPLTPLEVAIRWRQRSGWLSNTRPVMFRRPDPVGSVAGWRGGKMAAAGCVASVTLTHVRWREGTYEEADRPAARSCFRPRRKENAAVQPPPSTGAEHRRLVPESLHPYPLKALSASGEKRQK